MTASIRRGPFCASAFSSGEGCGRGEDQDGEGGEVPHYNLLRVRTSAAWAAVALDARARAHSLGRRAISINDQFSVAKSKAPKARVTPPGRTPHERIAFARERQPVLGLQGRHGAAALPLPGAEPPHVTGDALVEGRPGRGRRRREDVHVGDAAEGLIGASPI